jgi:fucose 4-O-acetylase-like acetyltransferase
MISVPHKTERLHSLDSLRAIMMMLGLVLHSVITYDTVLHGAGWPMKDPNYTHESMTWLFWFIHIFRMPVFFIVSGFFGALLFYERSPKKMFINRAKRVLFPFIVFLFLLWPFVRFGFTYSSMVFGEVENPLNQALNIFSQSATYLPPRTFHLWFLYYLLLFVIASFGLGIIMQSFQIVSSKINALFNQILKNHLLRVTVFSAMTFCILMFMNQTWVDTSTSLIPHFNTFIFYFLFYMFGWLLFKSKHLLDSFMNHDILTIILGTILMTITYFYKVDMNNEILMVSNAVTVWLFSFGTIGLFIRYGSQHSSKMRYISDASYWVYLLHLGFTAIFPGILADFNIPGPIKALIIFTVTTTICFVTYHFLVRATFIGKFLNGRKYTRKLSDIKKVEELNNIKPVANTV